MGGQQLGPYRLVRKLATGGMAEIFLAVRESDDGFARELVVKRILPNLAASPDFQRMFRAEARLAAMLSHPHVVHVYDYGVVSDPGEESLYLAMELVRGVDLRALIIRAAEEAARTGREHVLPPHHAAKIASYVCEALGHAHALVVDGKPAGIVHRDVTPSNVLLSFEGAVKLADFGVAKANTDDVGTRHGIVKGKRRYLSPEQARAQPLDGRSDLFNVGILLFESVLGEPLFPESGDFRPGEIPDRPRLRRLPTALADVAERALSTRPADRYPDALSMRADLEGYVRKVGVPSGSVEIAALLRELFPQTLAADGRAVRAAGTIASADVPRAVEATLGAKTPTEEEVGTPNDDTQVSPTKVADTDADTPVAQTRVVPADDTGTRLIASETITMDVRGLASRTAASALPSATEFTPSPDADDPTVVDASKNVEPTDRAAQHDAPVMDDRRWRIATLAVIVVAVLALLYALVRP